MTPNPSVALSAIIPKASTRTVSRPIFRPTFRDCLRLLAREKTEQNALANLTQSNQRKTESAASQQEIQRGTVSVKL
jgi:hypothetical protein